MDQPPVPQPDSQPPAAPPVAPSPPPTYAWSTPVEPSGPAPGFRFAGHGARLIAYIVDSFILGVVTTVIAIVGVVVLGASFTVSDAGDVDAVSGAGILGFLVLMLLVVVVSLAYFPWFWARSGATPGMRLFRLRLVRDADGGPIGGGQAILRLIGFWVSSFVFYLGFIWILIDSRRRGWHDLIAGTVMIESDR